MDRIRAHILVRGRVQGVFFRANMKRVADMHNVTGWVRNVPDGVTVEAVLEGTRDNVEKVICWSLRGPPGAEVRELKVEFSEYSGEFHSFRIIY
ncbi:MAG: acylphosphatase [Desulfurococcales archaeon]|nr:acylphosphatase [Desulfurococcales archaeon]